MHLFSYFVLFSKFQLNVIFKNYFTGHTGLCLRGFTLSQRSAKPVTQVPLCLLAPSVSLLASNLRIDGPEFTKRKYVIWCFLWVLRAASLWEESGELVRDSPEVIFQ